MHGGPKTGLFWELITWRWLIEKKARDMSEITEFCPEKEKKTCMTVHLNVFA